jgi:type II secretory pathway pseudopilin PulG
MKGQISMPETRQEDKEPGFCIIEVLVGILLIAIIAMGVTSSTIAALKFAKFTEANHIASSLAISKMEELAALSAGDLTTSLSGTEDDVTWPDTNLTFTRVTTITVNSDNSRHVSISVSSDNSPIPTTATFASTFAVWE